MATCNYEFIKRNKKLTSWQITCKLADKNTRCWQQVVLMFITNVPRPGKDSLGWHACCTITYIMFC